MYNVITVDSVPRLVPTLPTQVVVLDSIDLLAAVQFAFLWQAGTTILHILLGIYGTSLGT